MSKLSKLSIFAVVLALAVGFAFNLSPVQADGNFNLQVSHRINGRSLGLPKELPVDVYANGGLAFSFEFGDVIELSLPAGEYFIEVRPAGADAESKALMSLGPVEIPAGVDVAIRATLGAMKSPTLRATVK